MQVWRSKHVDIYSERLAAVQLVEVLDLAGSGIFLPTRSVQSEPCSYEVLMSMQNCVCTANRNRIPSEWP
jgi:hypothetical protein